MVRGQDFMFLLGATRGLGAEHRFYHSCRRRIVLDTRGTRVGPCQRTRTVAKFSSATTLVGKRIETLTADAGSSLFQKTAR